MENRSANRTFWNKNFVEKTPFYFFGHFIPSVGVSNESIHSVQVNVSLAWIIRCGQIRCVQTRWKLRRYKNYWNKNFVEETLLHIFITCSIQLDYQKQVNFAQVKLIEYYLARIHRTDTLTVCKFDKNYSIKQTFETRTWLKPLCVTFWVFNQFNPDIKKRVNQVKLINQYQTWMIMLKYIRFTLLVHSDIQL